MISPQNGANAAPAGVSTSQPQTLRRAAHKCVRKECTNVKEKKSKP